MRTYTILALDVNSDREVVREYRAASLGAALQAAWDWLQDEWGLTPADYETVTLEVL